MIHSRHLPPHWAFLTLLSSCMLYWSVIVWVMWLAGCRTGGVGGYWIRWVVIMTSLFCYCSHTYEDTSHTLSLLLVFTSCAHDTQSEFEKKVLPTYYNQSSIASFYRQANGWGFRREFVLYVCVRMVWIPIPIVLVPHSLLHLLIYTTLSPSQ